MSYYQHCNNCGAELGIPTLEESYKKLRDCPICKDQVHVTHPDDMFTQHLTELFEKVETLTKVVRHQQKQIKELSGGKT